MAEKVGDNGEVEVTEEFVASVLLWAMERVELQASKTPQELQVAICRAMVLETVHQLQQEVRCFVPWHHNEFCPDDKPGICDYCEKPAEEHQQVLCCPQPPVQTITAPKPFRRTRRSASHG